MTQKMRRVSLTEGVIKYERAGKTRPQVRLQGNMGSIPTTPSQFDDVCPEDSASQVGGADRLPVVVRIPAGPLGSLKCDPPKGNGRRLQKNQHLRWADNTGKR